MYGANAMKDRDSDSVGQAAPAQLSVRERGKQRRRSRIKEAARSVFIERGYEAATTREIADRAEVSAGTLFAYAPIKSELLLMIVNDDIEPLRSEGFRHASVHTPLIEVLLAFCEDDMAYWGKHPEIARQARREIGVVLLGRPAGPEAVRFAGWKAPLLGQLAQLVAAKQKAGHLDPLVAPELVAELWWAIYNQHLHNWLMDPQPNLRKGVRGLRNLLELAIRGLGPDERELAAATSAEPTPVKVAKAPAARSKTPTRAKAKAAS